ncbi:hypothetical protein [Nostoc piscinale]|uniref:hypothetical protein n=1 Tax=Nostoc piscinale TaxID=224012 RepID=UPI0007843567|nr:hypothetical protein [Nostoc piscinale]
MNRKCSSLVSYSVLAAGVTCTSWLIATPAQAVTFKFDNITHNSLVNETAGESQLFLDVTNASGNDTGTALSASQVLFKFSNPVGGAASSITQIYFDYSKSWTDLFKGLATTNGITSSGSGVKFEQSTGNLNLPGGNNVNFSADFGVEAKSQGGVAKNGVDPGEYVSVLFDLKSDKTLQDVLNSMNNRSLRAGFHVQAFANGGSEAFVNLPSTTGTGTTGTGTTGTTGTGTTGTGTTGTGTTGTGTTGTGTSSSSSPTSVPTSLVFNLDCVISGTVGNNNYSGGSNCANAGTSFGTITLKENTSDSKKVDVFVDLAGNNVHKLLDINLNFNDSLFPVAGQNWNVTAGSGYDVKSFTSSENNIKPGGYQGKLDFQISPKATGPSNDGYTATISLGSFDLDIKNFDFKDTLNNIFAAVHIGNYGNNPGVSGGNSIWVGSSSYYKPSTSTPPKKSS